jgi:putative nucleotidyltransferase with HDIG domain
MNTNLFPRVFHSQKDTQPAEGLRRVLKMARGHSVNFILVAAYVALTALLLQIVIVGITSGAFSARLSTIGLFLAGNLLGITSYGQLLGLARLNQPLLQQLLRRVPGTYHHSPIVGNLAEHVLTSLLQLMGTSVASGVFLAVPAILSSLGFFLVGSWLGIRTYGQLHELARLNQPLLQQLLRQAPGTYHHSLMVANLAEQAAERIGADGLLARVGAYYHDVGKLVRPNFFVENQLDGNNGHDRLDPRTSAQIIISHVNDGLDLAEEYHLPRAVRAFIPEHQGTGLVKYFYHQACKQADTPARVDEADFRYRGPKPQSRETAIVMLADSCEAAVRAAHPSSSGEIDKIVQRITDDKLISGELDECGLTGRDLDQICQAFVEMLRGVFHPRIQYPQEVKREPASGGLAAVRMPRSVEATLSPPTDVIYPVPPGSRAHPQGTQMACVLEHTMPVSSNADGLSGGRHAAGGAEHRNSSRRMIV